MPSGGSFSPATGNTSHGLNAIGSPIDGTRGTYFSGGIQQMPKRRCSYDNCPQLIPVGTRYCPTHARQHERDRGTPEQRGYDKAYRRTRLHYKLLMSKGIRFYCKRCNKIIDPTKPWDLGHDDSRRHITGPEHVSCNRRAGQNNSVRMRERWD